MKTILIIIVSLFLCDFIQSQETETTHDRVLAEPMIVDNKIIYLPCGLKYMVGNDIKLGTGTLPTGDFKFITISRGNILVSTSNTYDAAVGVRWSGHNFKIKRIQVYGNKKRGYSYYLILGGGNIVNYECDIQNAIKFGEVDVPEKYQTGLNHSVGNTTIINQGQISVADEITKLKKLLTDSIITQEEFDIQKKKILDKN